MTLRISLISNVGLILNIGYSSDSDCILVWDKFIR